MSSVLQASFTGGEISPNLYSRADLARWQTSLKTCRNWVTQPYGGAKNRSGTRYVATAKGACRLIPFKFNTAQQYVLEFGNLYMRVYMNGGSTYLAEVVTPYTLAEVQELKYTQSADVMTLVHHNHEPMNLSRTGHTTWTLAAIDAKTGPWLEMNLDAGTSIFVDKTVGTVTLTSTKAIWNASQHIGRLFYLEQRSYGTPWEVQKSITLGDIRRSDGKYYKAQNTATTGTLRPTHTTDTWSDGGVNWLYLHSGYGVCKITGVTSGTVATATILQTMPSELSATGTGFGTAITVTSVSPHTDGQTKLTKVGHGLALTVTGVCQLTLADGSTTADNINQVLDADNILISLPYYTYITYMPAIQTVAPPASSGISSDRWRLGAWGGDQGWPSVVTYYQGRRVYANSTTQPQTVWMTRSNAYNDFSVSTPIQDDDSLTFTLSSNQVNSIKGIITANKLVLLTAGAEWCLGAGQSELTTPGNLAPKPQGYHGSSDMEPLGVSDSVLYIQDKGKVVRDLDFDLSRDKYAGSDLTVFADHLLEGKSITSWAYQQDPFGIVWMVRNDGALLGMTYMKEQQVVGWHRHDTDGTFESVCCVSEVYNGVLEDAVYFVVNRSTGRFIERMNTRKVVDITDAFFVDSGLTYSGTPVTTVTGLNHLEGKTVSALFDGFVAKGLVVSGGSVTIPYPASKIHVGLPIEADIETLELTTTQGDTLTNKKKAITSVALQVLESRSIFAGRDADHLFESKPPAHVTYDVPVRLQDGLVTIAISTPWSTNGSVFIRQSNPLPITITAIIPEVTLGGV